MQEERRQGLWGQVCRPRFKPDLPLNSCESSATDFTTLCLSVPIYEMGVQQYVPPVAIWDKSEAKHVKLPARCLSHMPSTRAYAHSIPAGWVSPDVSSGHGTEILMLHGFPPGLHIPKISVPGTHRRDPAAVACRGRLETAPRGRQGLLGPEQRTPCRDQP